MSEDNHIHILDSTLRDGSHALSHQLTAVQVARVAQGLNDAGVEIIEVSHGDGLGGSTITYGFSRQSEFDLLDAASGVVDRGKLAVLLLPGIGTKDDLARARDLGAQVAQIATHVTEADVSEQHIELAKKMDMEVIGMLMLSHMGSPEKIAEQGKLMESYGADVVLVTDSAVGVAALHRQGAGAGVAWSHRHRGGLPRPQQSVDGHGQQSRGHRGRRRWLDACTCGLGAARATPHRGAGGRDREAGSVRDRHRPVEDNGRGGGDRKSR